MPPPTGQENALRHKVLQDLRQDDRRENVRIDDRVLLEYWPAAQSAGEKEQFRQFGQIPLSGSPETAEAPPLHSLVIQWMSKIEWTLAAILQSLENQSPGRLSAPRLMDVNICGDAVRFQPHQPLSQGDLIDLRMVLPPFIVVEARGEVFRLLPDSSDPALVPSVVVRFVDISDGAREKIIRYVIQRQAELLRRRQRSPQS